jgi:uncharacterized membrane protein
MTSDETTPIPSRQVYFDVTLHPNRSLSATGFYLVMGLATVFGFTIGIGFMLAGAWPVLGFCGVEILLLFFAFHINYRSGRFSEHLLLSDDGLEVRRVGPKGEIGTWVFEPSWLRVDIGAGIRDEGLLTITSHGASMSIGACLSPGERLDLADALRDAIETYRRPVGAA